MIHGAGFDELDARTLYRILRLRAEVFVVEQDCPYLDPDGRDTEAETLHLWADPDPTAPTVAAALRVLAEPDGSRRIGRLVTAAGRRGQGLAGIDAQARLEPWYAGRGFTRAGEEFLEDGIAHVPMRLHVR